MSLADEENVQPLLSEQSVITGEPITQEEVVELRETEEPTPEPTPDPVPAPEEPAPEE